MWNLSSAHHGYMMGYFEEKRKQLKIVSSYGGTDNDDTGNGGVEV